MYLNGAEISHLPSFKREKDLIYLSNHHATIAIKTQTTKIIPIIYIQGQIHDISRLPSKGQQEGPDGQLGESESQ